MSAKAVSWYVKEICARLGANSRAPCPLLMPLHRRLGIFEVGEPPL